MAPEQLTEMCRTLEWRYERELEVDMPFVIRLDGVNFKKLTARLRKPFDPRFTEAMLLTCRDLMESVTATTAFCQSDEISLFVTPKHHPTPFNGRCQKIVSVAAGIASARFTMHFSSPGSFDARVFSCPDGETMAGVAAWRHLYDCRRNAINAAGAANFSHESLQNQGIEAVISRLRAERGIDFYSQYPKESIYGVFYKRAQYEHPGFNPLTNQPIFAIRNRIESRVIDFSRHPFSALHRVLMARYWEADHPAGM